MLLFSTPATGKYSFKTKDKEYIINVAGVEKHNSDLDSLYLMDSDSSKSELGGILIKNSAWRKITTSSTITGTSSKTKVVGKLTKL